MDWARARLNNIINKSCFDETTDRNAISIRLQLNEFHDLVVVASYFGENNALRLTFFWENKNQRTGCLTTVLTKYLYQLSIMHYSSTALYKVPTDLLVI
jgi:hypothetical protein